MGCYVNVSKRSTSCLNSLWLVVIFLLPVLSVIHYGEAVNFNEDFYVTWGAPNNVKVLGNGTVMEILLDNFTASGFASKKRYLFGSIDMQIKLVAGDSAGTVTAYYFSSETSNHDEVDFEFLGNVSGQPYILQTNIFANGVGGREQRIYLWFDPTVDFHTYSLLWNEQHIILSVDDIPIRQFVNNEAVGVPYPSTQPMRISASIWNGQTWATRGGLDKVDWGMAPFVASFAGYNLDGCEEGMAVSTCPEGKVWWEESNYKVLDSTQQVQLAWVQQYFLIYNYCTDTKRYPIPPTECTLGAHS